MKQLIKPAQTIECDCKMFHTTSYYCSHSLFIMHLKGLIDINEKAKLIGGARKSGRPTNMAKALVRRQAKY